MVEGGREKQLWIKDPQLLWFLFISYTHRSTQTHTDVHPTFSSSSSTSSPVYQSVLHIGANSPCDPGPHPQPSPPVYHFSTNIPSLCEFAHSCPFALWLPWSLIGETEPIFQDPAQNLPPSWSFTRSPYSQVNFPLLYWVESQKMLIASTPKAASRTKEATCAHYGRWINIEWWSRTVSFVWGVKSLEMPRCVGLNIGSAVYRLCYIKQNYLTSKSHCLYL